MIDFDLISSQQASTYDISRMVWADLVSECLKRFQRLNKDGIETGGAWNIPMFSFLHVLNFERVLAAIE